MDFYRNEIVYWQVDHKVFVEVKILEVIKKFGKNRYIIQPITGKGETMVELLYKKTGNKIGIVNER